MQKTAQKRESRIRKLLTTDIGDYLGGKASEKESSEFAQIIKEMNDIDDGARAIALGDSVGDAGAPDDSISLKDLLRSVKSNINRREYMKAVADLGRFHRKMFEIVNLLSLFRSNLDKIHDTFLFKDLDEESIGHLKSFKNKWDPKAASYKSYFIKEANILDFFTNISTERGRALSAWEKRYPNKVKDLKHDTIALLSLSEKLLAITSAVFKAMDKARTVRNPDAYITNSEKIISAFRKYDEGDNGFKKFYEKNVKNFLEKQEFFSPTKVDTGATPENLGKQNIDAVKVFAPGTTSSPTKIPAMPPIPKAILPTSIFPTAPALLSEPGPINIVPKEFLPVTDPITGEITLTDPITGEVQNNATSTLPLNSKIAPAHKKFMNSLESMSNEFPILLAAHINKYAKSIWSSDPDSAIKLFKIAKSIKE